MFGGFVDKKKNEKLAFDSERGILDLVILIFRVEFSFTCVRMKTFMVHMYNRRLSHDTLQLSKNILTK